MTMIKRKLLGLFGPLGANHVNKVLFCVFKVKFVQKREVSFPLFLDPILRQIHSLRQFIIIRWQYLISLIRFINNHQALYFIS